MLELRICRVSGLGNVIRRGKHAFATHTHTQEIDFIHGVSKGYGVRLQDRLPRIAMFTGHIRTRTTVPILGGSTSTDTGLHASQGHIPHSHGQEEACHPISQRISIPFLDYSILPPPSLLCGVGSKLKPIVVFNHWCVSHTHH